MHLTGNKQEWGKIYGLFRLISNQGTHKGNRKQEAIEDSFLSLKSLSREVPEDKTTIHFEDGTAHILTNENTSTLPISEFGRVADILYKAILENEEEFVCEEAEALLSQINIFDFVSASMEGEDFTAIFYNKERGCDEFQQIRVKSNLSNLYLVASNRASNFKYDITQVKFSNPEAAKINHIGDNETGAILRLDEINRLGGKLKFTSTEGKFFWNALQLIDMQLPKLLAEITHNFYTKDLLTMFDLTMALNRNNPLKVKDEVIEKGRIYEYKIRQFLYAAACGMKPTKTWRGNGYTHTHLFITKKGDILLYNPADKEDFEKFLLFNTRLSYPNEDKNKFGLVEKENGQWLFKLNLEIRYI